MSASYLLTHKHTHVPRTHTHTDNVTHISTQVHVHLCIFTHAHRQSHAQAFLILHTHTDRCQLQQALQRHRQSAYVSDAPLSVAVRHYHHIKCVGSYNAYVNVFSTSKGEVTPTIYQPSLHVWPPSRWRHRLNQVLWSTSPHTRPSNHILCFLATQAVRGAGQAGRHL